MVFDRKKSATDVILSLEFSVCDADGRTNSLPLILLRSLKIADSEVGAEVIQIAVVERL